MIDKEKPLKERPLGIKFLFFLCVFILVGLPVITIIVLLVAAGFITVQGISSANDNHQEKRTSNDDIYGTYLYLDKIDEDVYVVVSENDDPDKRLVWDKDFCGYYDDLTDSYVWYDKNRGKWKYWFRSISSDYKDYGWMVYTPNGWKIEKEYADWIKLPEEYDRSRLWYIRQEE